MVAMVWMVRVQRQQGSIWKPYRLYLDRGRAVSVVCGRGRTEGNLVASDALVVAHRAFGHQIAGVFGCLRFDQENVNLVIGDRIMLDTFGHDK